MGDFLIIFVFLLETLRLKLASTDVARFSDVWIKVLGFLFIMFHLFIFSHSFLPECKSESLLVSLAVMKLLKH